VPVGKPRVLENSPAETKPAKKNKVPQTPLEVQRYVIDHAVNFSDLHFAQTPGGSYHDLLNFMVTAFDERSTLVASQIARTKADFSPEAMKDVIAGGVRMHQEIEVPVKSTTMRVGVEDLSNGHIGTIEIRLPVSPPPEVQAGARRALPPVEPD
jgi:hypothetical protein